MKTMIALTFALLLAACSPVSRPASESATGAASLDQSALAVSNAAAAYQASVTNMGTTADCAAATQTYWDQVQALIVQLTVSAPQVDAALVSMGRSAHGDVQCALGVMTQELARHMALACGSPDLTPDRTEALQHVSTMQGLTDHMRMRAAEVAARAAGWADGSAGSGGWNMPGGGMMSWDHQVSGCGPAQPGSPPVNPPAGSIFVDPPVAASTRNGRIVDVAVDAQTATLDVNGTAATVFSYNGGFVAPVVKARSGDLLRIHFTNSLPASSATNLLGHPKYLSNLHVHGMHVTPGTNADGIAGDDVFLPVAPGGNSLDYEHDLSLQPASSMGLYHPHVHGAVAEQIWGGLIGPIDIADDPSTQLGGYETHLLVLKDLTLSGGTPAPYDSLVDYVMGREGTTVMVNGQVNPVLAIHPGQVQRWRVFNASTARFYRLSLEGHSLNVIGTDGGLLDKPYPVTEILVAPAERIDVLVQASTSTGSYRLLALPYDRGGMDVMSGGMGGGMTGWGGSSTAQVTLLTLADAGATASDALPAQVNPAAKRIAIDTTTLPRTRFVLSMMMGRGLINGVSFDEMADGTVTAYVHDSKVGTYEVWEIVNQSGMDHPWHQHVNAAQVLTAVGPDPTYAAYADLYTKAPGLKDTVIVPKGGTVTLLVPVLDYAGKTVFHCHIVEHEDIGMMGIWNIAP